MADLERRMSTVKAKVLTVHACVWFKLLTQYRPGECACFVMHLVLPRTIIFNNSTLIHLT